MSQDMLGVVADIVSKLRNGSLTEEEAKRFARRENPFAPKLPGRFDPAAFSGKGWEVVGERKALPEGFEPTKLTVIATPLKKGESHITGDEAKNRFAGESLAGVEAFWRCWNDRDNLPTELRGKIILFDGDELRDPRGDRYALYLNWLGGQWDWNCFWLGSYRGAGYVSALAS